MAYTICPILSVPAANPSRSLSCWSARRIVRCQHWRQKWLQVPWSGSIRQRDMDLFNRQMAVAKMCSSISPPLSGRGCVHSTRDKPSNTRLRAIEVKSRRSISGSGSCTSILSVAGAGARAVSDAYILQGVRLAPNFRRDAVRRDIGRGRWSSGRWRRLHFAKSPLSPEFQAWRSSPRSAAPRLWWAAWPLIAGRARTKWGQLKLRTDASVESVEWLARFIAELKIQVYTMTAGAFARWSARQWGGGLSPACWKRLAKGPGQSHEAAGIRHACGRHSCEKQRLSLLFERIRRPVNST